MELVKRAPHPEPGNLCQLLPRVLGPTHVFAISTQKKATLHFLEASKGLPNFMSVDLTPGACRNHFLLRVSKD